MPQKRKTIGLALGGGFTRGLIHVGVIKALVKNNIPIDFMAGTSVGALVGAHYSVYENIEELEEKAIKSKSHAFYSFLDPSFNGGIIKGKRLEKLLTDWIGKKNFSNTAIPLTVIATDINTGEEVDIVKGDLVSAIMASSAIPILYKPVKRDRKVLVDGGLSNPVPDNIVKKMGADIVISVCLDNYNYSKIYKGSKLNIINVASRAFNIIWRNLSRSSMKNSDFIIEPKTDLVGFYSFKGYFMDKIDQKFINLGQKEAEKIIPAIKKLLGIDTGKAIIN
ncbi:MAG: patatin-like phospholipase family protein [Candidatus Buchananbacteria bacterium]